MISKYCAKSSQCFRLVSVLILLLVADVCTAESGVVLLRNAVRFTLNATFKSVKPGEFSKYYPGEKTYHYASKGWIRREINLFQDRRVCFSVTAPPPRVEEFFWTSAEKKHAVRFTYSAEGNWVWHLIYQLGQQDFLYLPEYMTRREFYDGIPCWVLTLRMPKFENALFRVSSLFFEYNALRPFVDQFPWGQPFPRDICKNNRELLRTHYFNAIEITIGRDNQKPFIYRIACFDEQGKVIMKHEWGKVEFIAKLDDTLWRPPGGRAIISFSNRQKSSNYIVSTFGIGKLSPLRIWWQNFAAGIGRFFASLGEFLSNGLEWCWVLILNYGGPVAASIAIILAFIIVVLKVRQRWLCR